MKSTKHQLKWEDGIKMFSEELDVKAWTGPAHGRTFWFIHIDSYGLG
jgi:hypothetical protein